MKNPSIGFYVRFLGGFYLEFEGKQIRIANNLKQKRIQILLILLKAGKEGVSYRQLIEMLEVEGEYFEKKIGNLRSQICKLRRYLRESGFPESKYLLAVKGRYYFNLEYPLESDTGRIDHLYRKLKLFPAQENREAWLREVCRIYHGEFLPLLASEEWAVVENSHYHEIYRWCMDELCRILKKQKNYTELLQLCTRASRLHPYDGWQAIRIDCLVAQDKYQEAAEVSKKANELFEKELGVIPFKENVGIPAGAGGRAKLAQVMEDLSEKEHIHGAYVCSYPHFMDACQILMRIAEREERCLLLLLCTLKPALGREIKKTIEKNQELEKQIEQFGSILAGMVRNQDVYTRCSKNQFLVLLMTAGQEESVFLSNRLRRGWKAFEQKEGLTIELEIQALNTDARKEVM